jgi:hypothetical protein
MILEIAAGKRLYGMIDTKGVWVVIDSQWLLCAGLVLVPTSWFEGMGLLEGSSRGLKVTL